MTHQVEPDELLDAVATSGARVLELARLGDLATPVPYLGRWRVRDVVAHLGGVHRWAARIVRERSRDGPSFRKSKLDGAALADWFEEGLAELLATLGATDPAEPCPTFNPGSPRTVHFWWRRQAHETTVHRWDVEHALGDATPIASGLAADGVDELLDVFVRTRGKQTLTAPLVLSASSPARSWTLRPAARAGRLDIAAGRAEDAAAEVSGPAPGLLLAVWGRRSWADAGLAVAGSTAAAQRFRGPPWGPDDGREAGGA